MKPFINKIGKITGVFTFDVLSNYVSKYSIDAILTDSDRKTLWIDGYPYGYGFYKKKIESSIVTGGDDAQTYWNSIVLNDYGTDARYGNIAIGNYSLASGSLTRAIGDFSTAEGYETWAIGHQSHAEGILSIAMAASSHVEGYSNTFTDAILSHAENVSDAKGKLSHAEGYKTIANGNITHAEGEYVFAHGWGSHAEGYGTETGDNNVNNLNKDNISEVSYNIKKYLSDTSSVFHLNSDITFNIDRNTTATATIYTVTNDDGVSTDITDSISYPVIGFTTATAVPFPGYPGYYAHAEGVTTRAKALGSHTEGFDTETSPNAMFSHAEGIGTKTSNYGEHAEGKYNYTITSDVNNKGTIHTIGIGDDTNRKNAVRVDTDGALYLCSITDSDNNIYDPCNYNGQAPNENEISIQEILTKSQIKWVSKTYDDILKDIESKSLIEGAFYKISDYTTVINSSNYDTDIVEVTSTSNPFDVIVLATSNNRLSETAWAIQNDNSGDRGLGNDIDDNGDLKTGNIDMYEDRMFIPKYYYYNNLGFITYYTPTNAKIMYFNNDGETVNDILYPSLLTNTTGEENKYVLDADSLLDNKGSITWESKTQINVPKEEYFSGFTLTYESSLLKTGEILDNAVLKLTLNYSLDTTEVINGVRYYKYNAYSAAVEVDPTDDVHKPSDFYIYDFSSYNTVYCKDYRKYSNESANISVSAPTVEPGKPPVYPPNPLYIKNSSNVGVEMTELFWEYTNSIKICNNISLSNKNVNELESKTTTIYFDTTDQVSIRKIINDNGEVKYVIISAYYSLSYFDNCNLNSWELKYCVYNDTNRFDWADPNGKGVIYYMKDEWGNECPYDFKNIKFNGKFTFTSGDSTDMSLYGLASQNSIKPYLFSNIKYRLNNITFTTNGSVIGNTFGPNCYNCIFDDTQSTTDIGYLFNEFKGGNNGITDNDANV